MSTHPVDGVLVVDKPVGPTSHDVVVCARRALGLSRIGHTGTLDPQAAGVLPLVLGQATRLAQHLSGTDKEYLATIRFGLTTDTFDAAGTVVERRGSVPTEAALTEALRGFVGRFEQRPPAYSAKMVDGARAYERARAGRPVLPDAVEVACHVLELRAFVDDRADVLVRCSAGFYVRSLAHDLGQVVGTGAILAGLIRTEAAGFRREQAVSLEWLLTAARDTVRHRVLGLESLLPDWPAATLTAEGLEWVAHGRELGPRQLTSAPLRAAPHIRLLAQDGRLMALAAPSKALGFLRPVVVFRYS